MSMRIKGTITQKTEETWNVQINQYEITNISYEVNFVQGPTQTFETQVSAEEFFDDYVNERLEKHQQDVEEVGRKASESATKTVTKETVEVYFKESDDSFEKLFFAEGDDYEPLKNPFIKRKVGMGGFGDAILWTKGGNKLEVVDFDGPRFTSDGISENLSGAISFIVTKGWRLTFTIESNSRTFTNFSKDEVEDFEGVEVDGREFQITMYGGDRLEVDIDNERDGYFPFVVTSAGQVWKSTEEIDDELFITLDKAERLYYSHSKIKEEIYLNPPREGEVKSSTVLVDETGPVLFNKDGEGYIYEQNIAADILQQIRENKQFDEAFTGAYPPRYVIQDIDAEGSFVSPEDIVDDITDPVVDVLDDVTGGIWDRFKVPIIIAGVVVVGALFFYIYRRTSNE